MAKRVKKERTELKEKKERLERLEEIAQEVRRFCPVLEIQQAAAHSLLDAPLCLTQMFRTKFKEFLAGGADLTVALADANKAKDAVLAEREQLEREMGAASSAAGAKGDRAGGEPIEGTSSTGFVGSTAFHRARTQASSSNVGVRGGAGFRNRPNASGSVGQRGDHQYANTTWRTDLLSRSNGFANGGRSDAISAGVGFGAGAGSGAGMGVGVGMGIGIGGGRRGQQHSTWDSNRQQPPQARSLPLPNHNQSRGRSDSTIARELSMQWADEDAIQRRADAEASREAERLRVQTAPTLPSSASQQLPTHADRHNTGDSSHYFDLVRAANNSNGAGGQLQPGEGEQSPYRRDSRRLANAGRRTVASQF